MEALLDLSREMADNFFKGMVVAYLRIPHLSGQDAIHRANRVVATNAKRFLEEMNPTSDRPMLRALVAGTIFLTAEDQSSREGGLFGSDDNMVDFVTLHEELVLQADELGVPRSAAVWQGLHGDLAQAADARLRYLRGQPPGDDRDLPGPELELVH